MGTDDKVVGVFIMFFLIKSINCAIGRLRIIDEKINDVFQHLLQNKTP